jgi:hypothetical protein
MWRGECTNEWFKGLLKSPKTPCENYSCMLNWQFNWVTLVGWGWCDGKWTNKTHINKSSSNDFKKMYLWKKKIENWVKITILQNMKILLNCDHLKSLLWIWLWFLRNKVPHKYLLFNAPPHIDSWYMKFEMRINMKISIFYNFN